MEFNSAFKGLDRNNLLVTLSLSQKHHRFCDCLLWLSPKIYMRGINKLPRKPDKSSSRMLNFIVKNLMQCFLIVQIKCSYVIA